MRELVRQPLANGQPGRSRAFLRHRQTADVVADGREAVAAGTLVPFAGTGQSWWLLPAPRRWAGTAPIDQWRKGRAGATRAGQVPGLGPPAIPFRRISWVSPLVTERSESRRLHLRRLAGPGALAA